MTLREGRIMRLSNVAPSFGFVLDVLGLARLNPTRLRDTLPLDSLVIRARMEGRTMELNPLSVRSPLVNVGGTMQVNLEVEPPVMELDLTVDAKGISKRFRERRLLERDTDANLR